MSLAEWKTLADIGQASVTTAAILIGGLWAYFKFIKGRTYRPHVLIDVATRWLDDGPNKGSLQVGVQLKNIGSAKVQVLQKGSAVTVSRLSGQQPDPPAEVRWKALGAYAVFEQHEWIEPSEVITDDLLLLTSRLEPEVVEVQVRIVLAWRPTNISVHARRVFLPGPEVLATQSTIRPKAEEE